MFCNHELQDDQPPICPVGQYIPASSCLPEGQSSSVPLNQSLLLDRKDDNAHSTSSDNYFQSV